MAKKWYDYTPVGFISNLATKLLGLESNPIGDMMDATSDQLFGTNYRADRMLSQQYQMNSQLAQDERAWQERMLAESRAYNSPANQMRLMRAAGLNPALAYGQLSDLGGTTPSAGAASVGIPSYNTGSVSLDALMKMSQIANIDADTDKKKGETRSLDIKNSIDGMNEQAFKVFFFQNENDIIRVMSQKLGIQSNEFIQSNYETFEAAWNFAIQFGLTLEDALSAGQVGYAGDFYAVLDEIDLTKMNDMFEKASQLFVGGRDAQIAANEAVRVINEAQKLKSQKDFDIWKFLTEKAKYGDKWERIGAQVALTALFISSEKFSIPMPSFSFHSFKKNSYDYSNKDVQIYSKNSIIN